MKTKIFILSLFLITGVCTEAQDVDFTDGYVLVDGKQCFIDEKVKGSNDRALLDLETQKEAVLLDHSNNKTDKFIVDDYYRVVFSRTRKTLNVQTSKNELIKKLIAHRVITADCKIADEHIDAFIEQFHRNVY